MRHTENNNLMTETFNSTLDSVKIAKEYNQKGFVIIKELISPQSASDFVEIAKRHNSADEPTTKYFSSAVRFFDPRHYKYIKKKINLKFYQDSYFLISRTKKPRFQSLINAFNCQEFGSLSRIDSYISPKSNKDITEWHTDQAFGGATHPAEFFGGTMGTMSLNNINRLFLHVTDVKYQNGCFSYIPHSHKINIAIRKLINAGKIPYKPIYLLEDAVNLVKGIYYTELLNILSKESLEDFINSGERAKYNDKDFVLECKAGDAVLFNDFGYHKGTAPQKSDRTIFRYWY
jgi:hypothetical protein